MSDIDYRRLRILVADDFSNFRTTVSDMLTKLGATHVDTASSGAGVLEACVKNSYDVILCDYDLGVGKNGQQVLEELRFKNIITHRTLFIIVSADAAKDIVMAAYDCEPDDYLMKPITGKMLQARMKRQLAVKAILSPAYKALEQGDLESASHLLTELSLAAGRHAICAQKLLGQVFIERGEYNKAEKLYRKAQAERPIDWARLGLAKVQQLRGEHDAANAALESLVNENPLYLPAYDAMAENWAQKGEGTNLQKAVQTSVKISPKSILRQKRLAEVAEDNGDFMIAIEALRSTVQLGESSCHSSPEDNLNFARVAASTIEKTIAPPEPLSQEAIDIVGLARTRFSLTHEQSSRADLLEGRAHVLAGAHDRGRALIEAVEEHNQSSSEGSLEFKIERIRALQTLGDDGAAQALIDQVLSEYEFDQAALQKIDALVDEPVSETNRAFVAEINREGIDLYNHGQFDNAVACFSKARRLFPKHVGIQLNIVQALVGKLNDGDASVIEDTQAALHAVSEQLSEDHVQYKRFVKLQDMAQAAGANP